MSLEHNSKFRNFCVIEEHHKDKNMQGRLVMSMTCFILVLTYMYNQPYNQSLKVYSKIKGGMKYSSMRKIYYCKIKLYYTDMYGAIV